MAANEDKIGDECGDLESHVILRLPAEPANVLHEALKTGSRKLKRRFSIKLDDELRTGEVRLDDWVMPAKVYDLPTITESLKTLDNKNFYKTADISQMIVCKEQEEKVSETETSKTENKNPKMLKKKYSWPHGITRPTKNVRKKRFRKVLRRNVPEEPDIDKEVKWLFSVDNEAVRVKWELVDADEYDAQMEEKYMPKHTGGETNEDIDFLEIFGGNLSDLETDDWVDIETSEFPGDILGEDVIELLNATQNDEPSGAMEELDLLGSFSSQNLESKFEDLAIYPQCVASTSHSEVLVKESLKKDEILQRMDELQLVLADLRAKQRQKEGDTKNIKNLALKERFQQILENSLSEIETKEGEYKKLQDLLKIVYDNE